jgi:hypothetical protein
MPLYHTRSMPLHRMSSLLPYRIMSTLLCRISSSLPYGISSTLHWYCMAGGVMGLFVCGVRWCGVSDVAGGEGFCGLLRVDVSSAFYRHAAHTSFRQHHRVIAAFNAHWASSMGFFSFLYTLPFRRRVWLCWCFLPLSASPVMTANMFARYACDRDTSCGWVVW